MPTIIGAAGASMASLPPRHVWLIPMVAPTGADDVTTLLPNGSPIRPKDTRGGPRILHVRPSDVAALLAAGYRLASNADLRAGESIAYDTGWSDSL